MSDGTIGDWNRAMAGAPKASAERLIGAGGLVVLSPHPDDETLGASALMQAAGRLGRRVGVVALTDGEASHRNSALFPPKTLAGIRRAEQAQAVAALGCEDAEMLRLGLPDGASGRSPGFGEAAEAVAELCDRVGTTVLAAPHPDDPHPDHHAAAALAFDVRALRPRLRLVFYEVWSRRLEADVPFRAKDLHPFRVETDVEVKRNAIARHRSQLGQVVLDDPDGFVLPDWFLAAQGDPWERYSWYAMPGRLPAPEHFERLYAGDGDPWHVRTSGYEAEKRAASIAALDRRRYRSGLEIGCGEGSLTRALSEVADHVTGIDREPTIVERARRHSTGDARVSFTTGSAPDDLPDGPFDLVVLSEVLYFLNEDGLAALAERLRARMPGGGDLLLVSYLGPTDTPLSGRDAADFFVASFGDDVRPVTVGGTADYRIERLELATGSVRGPAGGDGYREGEAAFARGAG